MMQTWVFQTNPKTFDINGYFATKPVSMLWRAKQHPHKMRLGDQVYIWRTIGGGDKRASGIIAKAQITQLPAVVPDDLSTRTFWTNPADADEEPRTEITFEQIFEKPKLQWSWIDNDPVVSHFRQRQGTNFLLTDAETQRFRQLLDRVGKDWTYAEVVAGLWAYASTQGGPVSKIKGSPVSDAALRSGRVVGGMYNKVMNFRAIDPTDHRAGLSAASQIDQDTWDRFFDQERGELQKGELQAEYERLWPSPGGLDLSESTSDNRLQLSLGELLERWRSKARKTGGDRKPPSTIVTTGKRYERDALVYQIALLRAGGECEVPACQHPSFSTADGEVFLEVHHIDFLANGGLDSPENTAAVCPAHHREAHHGVNAARIAEALKERRQND